MSKTLESTPRNQPLDVQRPLCTKGPKLRKLRVAGPLELRPLCDGLVHGDPATPAAAWFTGCAGVGGEVRGMGMCVCVGLFVNACVCVCCLVCVVLCVFV